MTAKILEGAEVAQAMEGRLFSELECLQDLGIVPTLAIVRAGDHSGNMLFERRVIECAQRVGVEVQNVVLPEDATQRDLLVTLKKLNEDPLLHGVLMCRPLPAHLNEDKARNMLDPQKDVDGVNDVSLGRMFVGNETGYLPCTAQACIEILDHFGYDLNGKEVVVVGRSLAVGRPVAMLLLGRNATVTIAHSQTERLDELIRKAEIVISCVGSPQVFGSEYFSPGQTVIDVGTNFIGDNIMVGDVDFDKVKDTVAAITPVPGGVGKVVTSTLVKHAVEAIKKRHGDMEIFQDDEGMCNVRFRRN